MPITYATNFEWRLAALAQLIGAWYCVLCSGWVGLFVGGCGSLTHCVHLSGVDASKQCIRAPPLTTEVLHYSALNAVTQSRYAMECSITTWTTTNDNLEPLVYVLLTTMGGNPWRILHICCASMIFKAIPLNTTMYELRNWKDWDISCHSGGHAKLVLRPNLTLTFPFCEEKWSGEPSENFLSHWSLSLIVSRIWLCFRDHKFLTGRCTWLGTGLAFPSQFSPKLWDKKHY